MANTTNFGWETPDDTDLVKDGAAAMRTLGNSIDASFVDLKGGTTGQILSKNSNTDLDFTWIANDQGDITAVTAGTGISGGGTSGAVTITNSMATEITASGDIIVGTGSGTFDNLPIGTTGQVLTADTTVSPYKVKWAGIPATTPTFAGCNLQKSANQTIANNTWTTITFDVEINDTDAYHDNVTNNSRITIPSGKGGYYLLLANCTWQSNTTNGRAIAFSKNGTRISLYYSGASGGSYSAMQTAVYIANFAVGDYLELSAWQNSGGNLTFYGNPEDTGIASFQVSYLGA